MYISLLFHLQFYLTLFYIYLYVFLYVAIFFNFYFLTLMKMFQIGLVDRMISMVFHQSCVMQWQSLFTLIISFVVVLSHILISMKYRLPFCMVAVIALYQRWARIRTASDWIRTEANFGRIMTGSDCNFFWKFVDQVWIGLRKFLLF